MNKDLNEIRKEIDLVDKELLSLLEKRFCLTDEIGCWKSENNYPVFDIERENQKLEKICNEYNSSKYCNKLCAVFKALMNESKYSQCQTIYGNGLIFLTGMPGCGKTSVGQELAGLMCAVHIDLDEEFKKLFRVSPAMFINQMGEDKFRKSESLVLKLSLDRITALKTGFINTNYVISCGGGIVTREENVTRMKEYGTIIYIRRELSQLDMTDRPISVRTGIGKLFEERKELYERYSDFEVENKEIKECASEILAELTARNKRGAV